MSSPARSFRLLLLGAAACAALVVQDLLSSLSQEKCIIVSTHILDVDYETILLYPGNYEYFLKAKVEERERKEAEEKEKAEKEKAEKEKAEKEKAG